MLDRKDIDAVIVATPDHWHAILTIMACQAGKDVYVEKGLSSTVREGRVAVETARKHNRIVQVGAQERSGEHFVKAVKLIQDGGLGAVHKVTANWSRNMMPGFKPRLVEVGSDGRARLGYVVGTGALQCLSIRCASVITGAGIGIIPAVR